MAMLQRVFCMLSMSLHVGSSVFPPFKIYQKYRFEVRQAALPRVDCFIHIFKLRKNSVGNFQEPPLGVAGNIALTGPLP